MVKKKPSDNLPKLISDEEIDALLEAVENDFYELKANAKDWTKKALSFFDYLDGLLIGKEYIGSYELSEIKKRLKVIQGIRNKI